LWFFFALDDCTAENGATWVVPRSHRSRTPETIDFGRAWRPLERELFADARRLVMRAGDLAVIDARTLHSSDRNDTDRPRRLINLGMVHSAFRNRVRANHWRVAGPVLTSRASPLVRRILGERWPDWPHAGPMPVLPPGWKTGFEAAPR
jgi:ectoine hydroxylase-related dioxygenase (phytanoyl-CoA dioxygenase family)